MGVRSGLDRGGRPYESPLGTEDVAFLELRTEERHYVSRYGVRIRDLVLRIVPPGEGIQAATIQRRMEREGGLVSQEGRQLGDSAMNHAVRSTMRWMSLRGEAERIDGIGHRRLLGLRESKWAGLAPEIGELDKEAAE